MGFFNVKVDIQYYMYLTEYSLFYASENILHAFAGKKPDFVNMNSIISYQH